MVSTSNGIPASFDIKCLKINDTNVDEISVEEVICAPASMGHFAGYIQKYTGCSSTSNTIVCISYGLVKSPFFCVDSVVVAEGTKIQYAVSIRNLDVVTSSLYNLGTVVNSGDISLVDITDSSSEASSTEDGVASVGSRSREAIIIDRCTDSASRVIKGSSYGDTKEAASAVATATITLTMVLIPSLMNGGILALAKRPVLIVHNVKSVMQL